MEPLNILDNQELRIKSEQLLQELKDPKKRERSVLALMPIGIAIATDPNCQEIIHNPASAKIFRIPPWTSYSLSNPGVHRINVYQDGKLLSPDDLPLHRAALHGETIENFEMVLHWSDGVAKHVTLTSRPLVNVNHEIIGALSTVKDITNVKNIKFELKAKNRTLEAMVRERSEALLNLQTQFSRLSRLDLLGELAGSIGHEIRNPMTTVRGYLQLLLNNENITDNSEIFEIMIDELDRANHIITEFLSISKSKASEFKQCNLNNIINTLYPLMEARGLMANVTIEAELNDIPALMLDANLIHQLLLNFANNGLEAMPTGGTLTITTYSTGDEVILAVKDQGSGIPLEHHDKISEPFFTTKENGTGLGLPVCNTIARKHDAKIDFTSSSKGTTFFIKFKK